MDHVDLHPPPQRSHDERRAAAALADLAGAPGSPGLAHAGGPGALTTVRRRAVRQRRRRLAGGLAASVAAAAAVGLAVPAVVPDGAIVAALGLTDRGSAAPDQAAPAPDAPPDAPAPDDPTSPAPDPYQVQDAVPGLPVLTDREALQLLAGAQDGDGFISLVADGALALSREPRSARTGDVGGWCRDTPLTMDVPAGSSWAVAWRTPDGEGARVAERVLSWGMGGPANPYEVQSAGAWVQDVAASTTRCAASAGSPTRTFRVLPEPSPGIVQAVAPVDGQPATWEVRTVAPTGSGSVVDLTVVVPGATDQDAARAVQPMVQAAVARSAAWDAAHEPGTRVVADPSANAPGSVVQTYFLQEGQLTLEQVAGLLPGAVHGPPDTGWKGEGPITVGCNPPFFIPDGATNPEGSGQVAFQAPQNGTTTVTERLLRYEDGTAKDYVAATNDPATVCEPAETRADVAGGDAAPRGGVGPGRGPPPRRRPAAVGGARRGGPRPRHGRRPGGTDHRLLGGRPRRARPTAGGGGAAAGLRGQLRPERAVRASDGPPGGDEGAGAAPVGEADDVEAFVAQRYVPMLRLARVLVGDPQHAEDLVQDVLARAVVRWRRVSAADDRAAYANRMLVNAATSWRRRPSRRESAAVIDDDRAAADATAPTEARAALVAALRTSGALDGYGPAPPVGAPAARAAVTSRAPVAP